MKLSIGGYSFNNTYLAGKMDVFGYLETVRHRYQLHAVDLYNGFFADKSKPVWELADESYIRKIREALDEKGMTVVNFAIDSASVWDPDRDKQERYYENALKHLRAAEILGAKTVRIDTGGAWARAENGDFYDISEEKLDHIVNRYKEYCDIAANAGFRIGPENHMGVSLNPHLMKQIAEGVDHSAYGILLHVDRWVVDREIGDKLVAPWACHLHYGGSMLEDAERAENIARMLCDSGYDGYWAIEHNADEHQYDEVAWALASMKRVWNRVQLKEA